LRSKILITVLIILLLNVVPIYANTSVNITVSGVPEVSIGITDFLITYINDKQMDLTWGYSGTVDRIMIRAKYGSYPANIPDISTAPTDGYLVYYGNGVGTSDTSMDFDQNPGILYYSAWGQNTDDTWQLITSQGNKESKAVTMLFLGIMFIAFVVVGFIFKKWLLFGAIIFIVALSVYLAQNNPITNLQAWVWYLVALLITVPLLFVILGSLMPQKKTTGIIDIDDQWDDKEEGDEYDVNKDYRQWKKKTGYFKSKRKNKYLKGLK
jgi:hypothetical protein